IANNPQKQREQLPYRTLLLLAWLPLGAAAFFAVLGGLLAPFDVLDKRAAAEAMVDRLGTGLGPRVLVVWHVHAGSYVGGGLGTLGAVAFVRWRRPLAAVKTDA